MYVRFRYDGSIFDLRRLSAKTKTLNSLIQEALFADDCALMAHKPGDLQAMLNSFSDASKQFGLSISLEKTEVLFQRAPNSVAPQPAIFIDDVELNVVDSFKYLGSMISVDGSLDKEIAYRISKASQALGRLRNRLLNHHNVTLDTKLKVYRAVVLPSLLYGCETWNSLKGSINVPFAPSLEYGGRWGLQTQKSLKEQTVSASKRCCWSPASAGQAMW